MLNWLKTPSGVIVSSTVSLMSFIARSLLDWRYTFPYFMEMTVTNVLIMGGINVAIPAVWVWSLVNLKPDRKAAYRILMTMNVFQFLLNGLLSSLVLCPSPCSTLWPVGEIIIWSSTVTGFLGMLSLWMYKRQTIKFNQKKYEKD